MFGKAGLNAVFVPDDWRIISIVHNPTLLIKHTCGISLFYFNIILTFPSKIVLQVFSVVALRICQEEVFNYMSSWLLFGHSG